MSRATLIRRAAIVVTAVVVVIAVITGIALTTVVRRSFPDVDGEATLRGLGADVTVRRDDHGIPQIYGDSVTDIARAQGYVHAQDRFFEMDLRRHVTAGRLAELVGEAGVETDKVVRTLGWRRVAEEELPTLSAETRRYLQAYAEGVNAYLRGRTPDQLALEYSVLSMRLPVRAVEDWTAVDSLAWYKAMAWDLRGDYSDELTRARLTRRMPKSQIDQLYPAYLTVGNSPQLGAGDWTPRAPTPTLASSVPPALRAGAGPTDALTSRGAVSAYAAVQRALALVPRTLGSGDGVGSNAFAVSSGRSSTGQPLLANDPHLAPGIPGIWYQVGLHCRAVSQACPLDVSGFSFSGVPGIVIGHNQRIAWGFTNLGPDVTDFYLEEVDARGRYLRDGEWLPLRTRPEVIKVAGGPDVTITVRSTGHGPVLSDVVSGIAEAGDRAPVDEDAGGAPASEDQNYAVSLAWTGLTPGRTADAMFGFNTAASFTEFRSAAKHLAAPSQNLVYADADGHIGYQAPGLIPLRRSALPGTVPGFWPAPGWDSTYDWKGWVPFDDMPWALDPKEGLIVSANQQVTAGGTPFLTSEWDYGYRAEQIRSRLLRKDKVSPADLRAIQLDDEDRFARTLVAALLAVPLADDDFTREAQNLLRGWDGRVPASGNGSDATRHSAAAAAFYNAVWSNLLSLLFDDELPADLAADGGDRYRAVVGRLLKTPKSAWWDNKQTPNVTEGKDEILRQALVGARLELTRKLGKDPESWQWGKLHRLDLRHRVLGGDDSPWVLRWLVNRSGIELPGGSSIVNANGWDASQGYDVTWAPSMRMVVDLGRLDGSTWINQTGQSGHPSHDHYGDQVEDWAEGRQLAWPFSEAAVRKATVDTLTLRPARD